MKVQERIEKYNCNGKCYSRYHMCPNAETCPETATKEFMGTMAAVLTILMIPVAAVVVIIIFIARWFI